MSRIDARATQGAISSKAVHICVGIPAAFMVVALLARSRFDFLATPVMNEAYLRIGSYLLIAMAATVLGAAFLAKRRILASKKIKDRILAQPGQFVEILVDAHFPLFLVAVVPAALGLIYFFLGGDLDTYVLISVFCPAGLMILRPKEEEIERLDRELFGVED